MNSQRYRIVFNKARGLLMVVGDLARRGGKQPRGRQVDGAAQCSCRLNPWSWAWLVLFGTVNVIGSAQAGIQADARSPGNEQPIIIGSANGIPLINIQTPSEGGVSRNSYRQFDVDGRGAILNNSRQDISTQLGGMVQGNPMLAGGEARIILNEVHSRDPSLLNGHIEVAGQRAQVVIANPAGISCSGCGFINAYRATLTTGQALMAEGRLTGYDVDRGEIVIQGTGLSNGDGQNYTDIIARSLSVNAELNASDLAITLGRNRVDADNRRFEKKSADDSAPPRLALDVASLGGMYAQQIRLIGTEDGVGVHNAGTVGAQAGAVIITTDGRIENSGRVGGKTDLALTSSLDIDNRGGLQIEGNATLKAGNAIYNSGSLHVLGNASLTAGNGIDNSGTLQAEGNASLKNGGAFHNSGTVSSRHDLHIQGGQLTSEPGSILAAGIQQNGSQVKEGNLTLDAQGPLRVQGQNLAAGDLVFQGQGVDVTQGRTAARNIKLDAGEGDLLTGGGATIAARQQFTGHSASVFNNDGGSLSADRFAIFAADLSNQQGQISQWGEDNLLLSLPGTLNNRGGHIASNGGDLTLNASHINNHSGHINHAAAGTLTFTSDILDNGDGEIAGNSHDMTLNVAQINNDNGQISHTSTGNLKIAGDSLQSQKGQINSNGRLTMTARGHALLDRGRIAAPQVTLTAGTLSNRDGQINATGPLSNRDGQRYATGPLSNRDGQINATGIGQIADSGRLLTADSGQRPATPGNGQLKVTVAEGLDNQRGHLTADGNVLLTAGSLNNQAGNLNANGDLRLDTGDLNNASGHITALQQGALDLQVRGLLDNQHGAIAAENITLHAGQQAVNNAAGTLAALHDLTLQSLGLNNDSGLLQAGNAMSMDLGEGRLSNRASGEKGGILSLGRLSIHSGLLDNQHGFIGARDDAAVATEDLHNAHGTLVSDGVLHLQTAALDNHSGVLQSGDDFTVQTQAQTLDNNSGWINASGALTLLTGTLLNQSGQLQSAGDLLLDTHGHDLDNRQGDIASAGRAAFTVAGLNNAQGQIRAVGDARVNAGQGRVDNTAGAIRSGAAVTISADSIINRDSHIDNGIPRDANAGITGLEGQSVILRSAELDNRRGNIRANQLLEITAGRELANADGLLSSAQVLKVQGENALRIGNNSGTLVAGKQLDLSAGALSGDGRVLSQDAMALSLQQPFFNTGEVTANGDMQLTLAQGLENSQRITAGGELNLHTASLTNHESGEISAAQNHLLVDGTLTNHGLLDGTLTHIVAANLSNIGSGRLYGDHIALSTGTLDNLDENGQAATVAARDRLDLGVQTLNNRSQGLIYSAGSLAIGGGLNEAFQAEGRANLFTNHSATLESAGDMSLNIDRIVNANDTLVTRNEVTERSPHHDAVLQGHTQRFEWADIDTSHENDYGVHNANMPDGTGYNRFYEYDYQRTVTETQIVQSEPAKILAGGNLTINSDQVRNSDSQILAGGLLGGTINHLQNLATPGERIIQDLGKQIYWYAKKSGGGIGGTKTSQGKKTSRYQPAAVVQTIDLKAMAYQGSAAVDGSGTRLEPRKTTALTESVGNPDGPAVQLDKRPIDAPTVQTVEIVQPLDPLKSQQVAPVVRTASPDIHLPVSSLFQLHPDFTSQYLVETDPRFTNRKQWLGSDYMQQAINHDAGHMLKRLGDGYYEQQVIRNQVINLTGQRYLSGFNNDSDQFKALMDAGIAFGKRYSLTPGVALTPEQMALLTSNMVWLVKQDVTLPDGSVQSVVAPQLYARLQQGDLDGSGALLSGNHVGLDIQQDLTNSGAILGREVTRLSADNLTNSGFIGGKRTDLTARTDMVNRGGTLSGGDSLTVRADRDIISQSTLRGDEEHRAIDRAAGLYVQNDGGTLALKALQNITLTATQASTVGADSKLNIAAGNTLTLDTLTQTHTENNDWSQDTYRHLSQHDDVGSQLNSQGSIALTAGHDLNAKAASVTAAGALTAEAGHDITLSGGQSGFTLTEHDKQNRRNMLSATSLESHDQVTEQNNLGSNFSGNSQDIKAGHDLLVTGSSVAGTEDVSLTAGHRLAIETADQTRLDQHWNVEKTSGLTGTGGLGFNYGSNSLKISDGGTVHSSAGSTVGSTEGTVRLEAGQGLKIKGSDVLARKDIALKGQQVAIGHADNHSVQTHRVDQMQSGLTLALSGLVGGIANTAVTTINQAGTQSNGRLAALDGIKSALSGVQAYQGYAMEQAQGKDGTLIGLNLSYGAQSSTSEQTQTRHQSQGSQLTAG
ncbi:two-partner secretion domain-containing protein, partial [Biostraticola tofi]